MVFRGRLKLSILTPCEGESTLEVLRLELSQLTRDSLLPSSRAGRVPKLESKGGISTETGAPYVSVSTKSKLFFSCQYKRNKQF